MQPFGTFTIQDFLELKKTIQVREIRLRNVLVAVFKDRRPMVVFFDFFGRECCRISFSNGEVSVLVRNISSYRTFVSKKTWRLENGQLKKKKSNNNTNNSTSCNLYEGPDRKDIILPLARQSTDFEEKQSLHTPRADSCLDYLCKKFGSPITVIGDIEGNDVLVFVGLHRCKDSWAGAVLLVVINKHSQILRYFCIFEKCHHGKEEIIEESSTYL